MRNYIMKTDLWLSGIVHRWDNKVLTLLLYPCGSFFHPKMIWISFLLVYLFSNHNFTFTIMYSGGSLICLIFTYLLKKLWKRSRPSLLKQVNKPHTFRLKQKNNSMPSGDAFQSAFCCSIMYYLGFPIQVLILFHFGVCLARVYFMCHWFLDTFVASVIGIALAIAFCKWFIIFNPLIQLGKLILFYLFGIDQYYKQGVFE